VLRQEFCVLFGACRTARGGNLCRLALIPAAPRRLLPGQEHHLSARRGGRRVRMHRRYAKKNIPIELLRGAGHHRQIPAATPRRPNRARIRRNRDQPRRSLARPAACRRYLRQGQGNMTPTNAALCAAAICAAHARHERRASHLCRAEFGAAPVRSSACPAGSDTSVSSSFPALFGARQVSWSASAATGSKGCWATSMSAR